jgi:hypothetical protein
MTTINSKTYAAVSSFGYEAGCAGDAVTAALVDVACGGRVSKATRDVLKAAGHKGIRQAGAMRLALKMLETMANN